MSIPTANERPTFTKESITEVITASLPERTSASPVIFNETSVTNRTIGTKILINWNCFL